MHQLREQAQTSDAKETKEKLVKLLLATKNSENKLDEFCMFGTDDGI